MATYASPPWSALRATFFSRSVMKSATAGPAPIAPSLAGTGCGVLPAVLGRLPGAHDDGRPGAALTEPGGQSREGARDEDDPHAGRGTPGRWGWPTPSRISRDATPSARPSCSHPPVDQIDKLKPKTLG